MFYFRYNPEEPSLIFATSECESLEPSGRFYWTERFRFFNFPDFIIKSSWRV